MEKNNHIVKNVFILLLGIASIGTILTWWSNSNRDPEQPALISNTTKTDEFENKQKCIGYRGEIEEKMSKTEWTNYSIQKIFYSPVTNSCLFSVIAYQKSSALLGTEFGAYMIWDFFDDELIFYRDTSLVKDIDIEDMYNNAVEYLQGQTFLKYDKSLWNS